MADIYTSTILIKYNLVLCFLLSLNILTWSYLLYEFVDEQKRKKYGSFFVVIIMFIAAVLCGIVGTLIGRGIYITNCFGWTNASEFGISSMNHIMQIILSAVFLLISLFMIYTIRKKRKQECDNGNSDD